MKKIFLFLLITSLTTPLLAQDPWWEPGWTFNFKEYSPPNEGPVMEIELSWRMDHGKKDNCEGPTIHWKVGQVWLNGYLKNGEKIIDLPGINESGLIKVYSLDDVLPKELKDTVPLNLEVQYTIVYAGTRTQLRQQIAGTKALSVSLCDQPPFPGYAAKIPKWYTESMIMDVQIIKASFAGQSKLRSLVEKARPGGTGEEETNETDAFVADLMSEFDPGNTEDDFNAKEASDFIINESSKSNKSETNVQNQPVNTYDAAAYKELSALITRMENLLLTTLQKGVNGQYDMEDFNQLERLNQEYAQKYKAAKNQSSLSPQDEKSLLAQHQKVQERILNITQQRVQSANYENSGYSYSQVQQVNCDQIINKLRNAKFNYESRRRDAIAYELRRCDCLNGKIWNQGNGERTLIMLKRRRDAYYQSKDKVHPGHERKTSREPELSPVPSNCNWRK